jgi:hypothetical protein
MADLDTQLINSIATSSVTSVLGGVVRTVRSEPTTDSVGEPALRITVVLTPGSSETITGTEALTTLVNLQRALRKEGENRFPILGFATEEELAAGAD